MPGGDVLRRLKQNPRTRDIPVVVISADATRGRAESLLRAGADDYLTKPLDVHRFLEVVDFALNRESHPIGRNEALDWAGSQRREDG
jgi:CheY-like chemotaxis protein